MEQRPVGDLYQHKLVPALAGASAAAGLYAISRYNYLLFHSLIELFSVVVLFALFILAWNTRRLQDNHYLPFMGIASLFTGIVEILHALAYKGMGVFPGYDADLPTQFWIAFRSLFSFSFLLAPLFIRKRLRAGPAVFVYAAVTTLLTAAIFLRLFPACYVEGSGLTQFKINAEYAIIAGFLASLALVVRKRRSFDAGVARLVIFSLLCSVLSEFSFTKYVSVYGPANMLGHLFLSASVFLLYRAIVVTGLVRPSDLLYRNLKQSEEALRRAHDELELRVRERTAELARTNDELEKEIGERRKAEREILKLNSELERRVIERTAELEAANKELEAFAYSVSHDLRAPLRAIDGFSQAIEDDEAERLSDPGKDHFQRIRDASRRMGQLIDALLSLSRMVRGTIGRTKVDLSALARSAADDLRRTRPGREVEFIIADGVTAEGDPAMLRAAVDNLLSNAWKFTGNRDKARIEFGVTHKDGEDVYFVRDNGAGFDMAYASKLFTAFQRLHGASEFPGIGVGLATVQRIVHRHGGRIWAHGEVDGGAAFYFTLGGGPHTPVELSVYASEGGVNEQQGDFAGRRQSR
jgi:signal transduction histidine kinase